MGQSQPSRFAFIPFDGIEMNALPAFSVPKALGARTNQALALDGWARDWRCALISDAHLVATLDRQTLIVTIRRNEAYGHARLLSKGNRLPAGAKIATTRFNQYPTAWQRGQPKRWRGHSKIRIGAWRALPAFPYNR